MKSFICCVTLCVTLVAVGANPFRILKRGNNACSQADLEKNVLSCVEPLIILGDPLANLTTMDNQVELDRMCKTVDRSKDCIQHHIGNCFGREAGPAVQTVRNLFGYICGRGQEALLSEAPCWENDYFEDDMKQCGDTAQDRLDQMGFAISSGTIPVSEMCPVLTSLVSCARRKVLSRPHCGMRAATFVEELLNLSLDPTRDTLGCHTRHTATSVLLRATNTLRKRMLGLH